MRMTEGDIDCFGRLHRTSFGSTRNEKILDYWYASPLKEIFNWDFRTQIVEKDEKGAIVTKGCMACGIAQNDYLERAHVKARCNGGSNHLNNLHMLCKSCHRESEDIDGLKYWVWLHLKSQLWTNGFYLTMEVDGSGDGWGYYPYEAEFYEKLKDKSKLIYWYHLMSEGTFSKIPKLPVEELIKIKDTICKDAMCKDDICKNPMCEEKFKEEVSKLEMYSEDEIWELLLKRQLAPLIGFNLDWIPWIKSIDESIIGEDKGDITEFEAIIERTNLCPKPKRRPRYSAKMQKYLDGLTDTERRKFLGEEE